MESRHGSISGATPWLPISLRGNKKTDEGTPPNERTVLLPKPDDEEQGELFDVEDGDKSKWHLTLLEFVRDLQSPASFRSGLTTFQWILLQASIPVILAYTLQNSLQTVSVLIVGRLSPEALATSAFAYMFAMATGWLIALGGTTAIDTLASATFTGSKDKHDLGIILQRSFIILFLFYIPVVILWIFSEPVFNALGQEPYLARDAARFLWVLIPGGLGYIYFEAMKKYLQAQGKLVFTGSKVMSELTRYRRNHETGHVCSPCDVTAERSFELPLRLQVWDWSSRCANRDEYFLLAVLPVTGRLCPVRHRLGMLGWLEQ